MSELRTTLHAGLQTTAAEGADESRKRVPLSAPPLINGKEIFDLLHDDLAALEDEFGQDTVSGVEAITEIGEYLRNEQTLT